MDFALLSGFPMLQDPWFYVAALPAVLITGLSKGGFGSGSSLLALPLLSLTIPPLQAAAITLPVLCMMDLAGLWGFRGHWDRANMAIILPGALIGIAIGTLTAGWVSNQGVQVIVGVVAIAFVLHRWLARGSQDPAARSVPRGLFWSAVAGFTSFIAHAGGPPLSVYLVPQRLEKTLYLGTNVMFFAAINYIKLVPYAWLGQFNPVTLGTAALLAPVAVGGVYLGMWLNRFVSDAAFYRSVYIITLLCGLKLLADGIRG